jgi:hypothetical protein
MMWGLDHHTTLNIPNLRKVDEDLLPDAIRNTSPEDLVVDILTHVTKTSEEEDLILILNDMETLNEVETKLLTNNALAPIVKSFKYFNNVGDYKQIYIEI